MRKVYLEKLLAIIMAKNVKNNFISLVFNIKYNVFRKIKYFLYVCKVEMILNLNRI